MISVFSFAQNKIDSTQIQYNFVENEYNKSLIEYKNVLKYDSEIENCISAVNEFRPTYNKILELDNLDNKQVQKALVENYAKEYYDLFNYTYEGKKHNMLLYGFDSKEEFKNYIDNTYHYILNDTSLKINRKISDFYKKEWNDQELYINSNLKRLGIKRETWDKMSENDKDLLWKTFKH